MDAVFYLHLPCLPPFCDVAAGLTEHSDEIYYYKIWGNLRHNYCTIISMTELDKTQAKARKKRGTNRHWQSMARFCDQNT
ncbi:hypothetical protein BC936DRAFT_147720 [Jimgerdemannia flammicorona]|uniref:Uncharacterized protein n=1 Tax=Jimgerdemannia flammicorona TaxID=994334 RepID=A0A433D4N8_9FUNG|nr:hypothetical protein BC936DRAFT_147720 [Jimgerdemannia flammicorona]